MKYAAALRAIGQDFERRDFKAFDIRCEGDAYAARCGYQAPPSELPVSVHYTLKDLQGLDEAAKERRGEAPPAKDFLDQVQIFRTIGGYMDKINGRLLRLTNNQNVAGEPGFRVEYINADGEHVVDSRTALAVYDMCVAMYKQRGKLTGTGGLR